MPQRRIFDTRSNKESFKRRRKALLAGAENILQDGVQVLVMVRQSDAYYCYNSDNTQPWFSVKQSRVGLCLITVAF